MKWLPVALLAIVGLILAFVAIEYATVSIHSLPSFIPGRRPVNGRYHVRSAFTGLVAIVALAGAVVLAVRILRPASVKPEAADSPVTGASTAELLGGPPAESDTTDAE